MKRKKKETYNVKTYWCKSCGHIFHNTKVGLKTCNKIQGDAVCGGDLKVIDEYKSRYLPRGSPPPGRRWQVKGGPYKRRK